MQHLFPWLQNVGGEYDALPCSVGGCDGVPTGLDRSYGAPRPFCREHEPDYAHSTVAPPAPDPLGISLREYVNLVRERDEAHRRFMAVQEAFTAALREASGSE